MADASLIVTVDTEEDGLWSDTFRVHGNTVENTRGIERFQDFCDAFGVRPTYLVDSPVVEDSRSVDLLGNLYAAGRCEIGGHLHPWCAPPFEEEVNSRNSFLCNLPEGLQFAKLRHLTERIEERIGVKPRSFRAGRYGLDIVGARILEELGYWVDSSVLSFTSIAAQDGPDFQNAPYTPYYVGSGSLCDPDPNGALLEIPVSVGYNRLPLRRAHAVHRYIEDAPWRRLRLLGILDRLNLLRRIKFSPEKASGAAMNQLVDAYLVSGAPCMVMMLHSSSLVPGGSPYVRDKGALDQLYRAMEITFGHCLRQRGMTSRTLEEYAASVSQTTGRRDSEDVGTRQQERQSKPRSETERHRGAIRSTGGCPRGADGC